MHAIIYIVCFFFYRELFYISKRSENSLLWSVIYGLALFVSLLTKPTMGMFMGSGRPSLYEQEQYLNGDYWQAAVIDASFFQAFYICTTLAILFYFTSRIGGYIGMRSLRIAIVIIPGLLINTMVAFFLLSSLI